MNISNNKTVRILAYYVNILLSYSVLFFLLFHTPLLQSQDVLFFRGFGLIIITTALILLFSWIIYKKWKLDDFNAVISAVIMSASFHICFFILFPVTFERSVTMYYLNELNDSQPAKQCAGLTKKESEQKLIEEYILEQDAVSKRLHEQAVTGFVIENNDCITITRKGQDFLEWSERIKKIYNIN